MYTKIRYGKTYQYPIYIKVKGMGWYLDKNTKLRGILLYILVNANMGNGRDVPNMS